MANHHTRSKVLGTRFEIRRVGASLLVFVGSLLLAFGASAQQVYKMNQGLWARSIPSGVIPFAGEVPHNCDFLVRGRRSNRATAMGTPAGIPQEMAGAYGCPSGMGGAITATMAGVGGAFVLPANIITQPARGYLVAVPIPNNANQIQAATDGTWIIPNATRGMGGDALGAPASGGPGSVGPTMRVPAGCVEATCMNLAPFRRFHRAAWQGGPGMTFNGQTGRAGANFTWCWGKPGCMDIVGTPSAPPASNRMLVKYKAGPNAFGGTLSQLTSTGIPGSITVLVPGLGYVFNTLDSGMGQIQHQGRGYADFLTEVLPPAAQVFMTVQIMNVYEMALPATVPLITMVTGGFPPPAPFNLPQINQQYAFPLTTGTVVVRRTSPLAVPVVTLSAMGGDAVTAMGVRNISLVSGAVSNLSIFTANNVTLDQLYLPEPGQAGGIFAGALGLLGLAAWRARKLRA